jgi:hypothetical protein
MAKDNGPAREAQPDPERAALLARLDALEGLVREGAAREARLDAKLHELAGSGAGITLDATFEEWKRWAALSATEKTQLVADKKWGHETAPRYRVGLPDHPTVVLPVPAPPGSGPDEIRNIAVGRYNALCGITSVRDDERLPMRHAVAPVAPAA